MSEIKKTDWESMSAFDLIQQKALLIDRYFLSENTSPEYAKLIIADIENIESMIEFKLNNPTN